jgi:hypothetical protein
MLTGAATVFTVRDMTKSVEHYCNALGFAVTFQYGNPIFYTCLCRDEVALNNPSGFPAMALYASL